MIRDQFIECQLNLMIWKETLFDKKKTNFLGIQNTE